MLTFDGIGDEAFAVVDVPDMDLFVLTNVGGIKQVFVDGAGAFVMELALGRGNAVDLGFQEGAEHGGIIVAQAEPNLTNAAQHPGLLRDRWLNKR